MFNTGCKNVSLHHIEPLDEYCHSCGMKDLSTGCDDDWVSSYNYVDHTFSYSTCTMFLTMQVKCDCCDWWYHLQCINKKIRGNYSMENVESLDFKGPCCTDNGQFSFN